jgi:hypothetical protein
MRQFASVLLLVVVTLPLGAKWKDKDKRFDAVRITDVRQVAGKYVGIDPDYVVALELDGNGKISGTLTQFGVASPLRDLRISGSQFSASIGGLPINGTFVKRVRDGATSFGLLVHDADMNIDKVTLNQIFCRRVPTIG